MLFRVEHSEGVGSPERLSFRSSEKHLPLLPCPRLFGGHTLGPCCNLGLRKTALERGIESHPTSLYCLQAVTLTVDCNLEMGRPALHSQVAG